MIKPSAKAKERQRFLVELDKPFAIIIKTRDGWKCVKCGRTKAQGWQMHCAHIKPKGKYQRLRYEYLNAVCLCAKCHGEWHDESGGMEWIDALYPGRRDCLNIFAATAPKLDLQLIRIVLTKEVAALGGGV